MPSVLFVCVANSFRSQLAEAIAKSVGTPDWEIWSTGSNPSGVVHPQAIALGRELGLDLSAQYSKGIDAVPKRTWDFVVTMGCGDHCPTVAARTRLDWELPDPASLAPTEARQIRDALLERITALMTGTVRDGDA